MSGIPDPLLSLADIEEKITVQRSHTWALNEKKDAAIFARILSTLAYKGIRVTSLDEIVSLKAPEITPILLSVLPSVRSDVTFSRLLPALFFNSDYHPVKRDSLILSRCRIVLARFESGEIPQEEIVGVWHRFDLALSQTAVFTIEPDLIELLSSPDRAKYLPCSLASLKNGTCPAISLLLSYARSETATRIVLSKALRTLFEIEHPESEALLTRIAADADHPCHDLAVHLLHFPKSPPPSMFRENVQTYLIGYPVMIGLLYAGMKRETNQVGTSFAFSALSILLRCDYDEKEILYSYQTATVRGFPSGDRIDFDPGFQIKAALTRFVLAQTDPHLCGAIQEESGIGDLLARLTPIVLFSLFEPDFDIRIRRAVTMTHIDSSVIDTAIAYARLLKALLIDSQEDLTPFLSDKTLFPLVRALAQGDSFTTCLETAFPTIPVEMSAPLGALAGARFGITREQERVLNHPGARSLRAILSYWKQCNIQS